MNRRFLIACCVDFVVGISAAWWAVHSGKPHLGWLIAMVAIAVLFALIGLTVVGRPTGIFIDRRNVMSLSRFQMALWTTLFTSAILIGALWNLHLQLDDPLGFSVPAEVWALMGVATTSLVGASVIVGSKGTDGEPNPAQFDAQKSLLQAAGDDPAKIGNIGLVVVNTDPAMARWTDMITGDETGNAAQIDLSKCQMLLFTLVVALMYGASLWALFVAMSYEGGFTKFPGFDASLLTMIGISHAGYLVYKATPHNSGGGSAPAGGNGSTPLLGGSDGHVG